MARARSKLDAYFSPAVTAEQLVVVDDPSAAPFDRSHGRVTRAEALWRDAPVTGGLFDPTIFGPLDGSLLHWGHVELPVGVTIARTTITKLPIAPIADRRPAIIDDPLARALVHGRIDDAWLALLEAIGRYEGLVRIRVPAHLLAAEARHLQHHVDDVLAVMRGEEPASHHDQAHHDPAHEHAHHDHAHIDCYTMMPCPAAASSRPLALLFVDDERLLFQSTTGCRLIDRAGQPIGPSWTPTGPTASSVHGEVVVFGGGQRDVWPRRAYPDSVAWPEDAVRRAPFAAYDLRARRWIMLVDERFPSWVVDETDVAGADALELATYEPHDLVSGAQRGSQLAQTRDGRFVLLSVARLRMHDDPPRGPADTPHDDAARDHAAHDHSAHDHPAHDDDGEDAIDRALVIVEVATQRPFVCLTDSLVELPVIDLGAQSGVAQSGVVGSGVARSDRRFGVAHPSVACSAGDWRVVDRSGAIGDGTVWWARLRGAICTAWSPSGAQLATIVPGDAGAELVILDVTPSGASVVSRAPISE